MQHPKGYQLTAHRAGVCIKIEIQKVHEIHSNATSAKYRNPRNPQTVRNPHWQSTTNRPRPNCFVIDI